MTLHSDPSELWTLIGGSPEGGAVCPPLVARKVDNEFEDCTNRDWQFVSSFNSLLFFPFRAIIRIT
jgi:hypothetical protein